MSASQKILLSGVKPTGRPHIGNYFGAMRQFVNLLNSGEYTCYFMIADYHALTTIKDAEKMRQYIIDLALDYLAIGLDPKKAIIFKQSDVSAHTELTWIFDTLVTVSFLQRAHAYKETVDKKIKSIASPENFTIPQGKSFDQMGYEIKKKLIGEGELMEDTGNVGTFNYPVLMAADILLYDAQVVPVGQDQKQHIEYTRDIAQKFNGTFSDLFTLPNALMVEDVATVPGIDGRKMSKSYGNTIPLFADEETIKKAVMSIVTDSKSPHDPKDPEQDNIFALHKLFTAAVELEALAKRYRTGTISYKESKELLIEKISAFSAPLRERRAVLEKKPDVVREILARGGEQARAVADAKMKTVREAIGVNV